MHHLRPLRHLLEAVGEKSGEQRLRARQDHTRLDEQRVDSLAEIGLGRFVVFMAIHERSSFATAPRDLEPIPEQRGSGGECRAGNNARQGAEQQLGDDEGVDADAKAEREQRQFGHKGGEGVQPGRVAPALGQPMEGSGRDEEGDGGAHECEPGKIEPTGMVGEALEARLKHGVELKAQQDLRAENQHARLVESVGDLGL